MRPTDVELERCRLGPKEIKQLTCSVSINLGKGKAGMGTQASFVESDPVGRSQISTMFCVLNTDTGIRRGFKKSACKLYDMVEELYPNRAVLFFFF